jgi:hypothetical protein
VGGQIRIVVSLFKIHDDDSVYSPPSFVFRSQLTYVHFLFRAGVSYVFGTDVISKFLKTHDLDLMARAHQVVEDGYEFCANRKCVTVFSAPQYCGEFDNAAGMLLVNEDLVCSFKVLKSRYWK